MNAEGGSIVNRCALRGNTENTSVFRFDAQEIVRCAGCGLCFATPMPSREEIRGRYSAEYFEGAYGASLDPESARDIGVDVFARIGQHRTGGRLLDVGCGAGEYLAAATARGWESFGVDVSPYAAGVAAKRPGVTVRTGFLDEAQFENDFFDAALMIHSLEHQTDPPAVLAELRRVLKPGGVLYISVPNINSGAAKRMGRSWPGLQPGRHFYFFTPSTLREMVTRAGFNVAGTDAFRGLIRGNNVDSLMGGRLGPALRGFVRRRFGGLIDAARRGAARLSEGDAVTLLALKPEDA